MKPGIDRREVAIADAGCPRNIEDWSPAAALAIAEEEALEFAKRYRDLIGFCAANSTAMAVTSRKRGMTGRSMRKTLYDPFPGDPGKQGGRIAGLPESRRKGGYRGTGYSRDEFSQSLLNAGIPAARGRAANFRSSKRFENEERRRQIRILRFSISAGPPRAYAELS
jgi:tRNA 2-thiouridine synthesizing protein E